jgi:hypothetical protein
LHEESADDSRKLISYNVDIGEIQAAKQILMQLPPASRKDPISSYLGYVIALKEQDEHAGIVYPV